MKNILISGGAGFIGTNLASTLSGRGHKVTLFDNLSPQIHGANPDFAARALRHALVRGDVRSRDDWLSALANQQIVIHLAAETGTGQSMYQVERYTDVNVRGTAVLLDILANAAHNVEKMIIASSRAVYGEGKYNCSHHGVVYPGPRSQSQMTTGDFAVKCEMCGNNLSPLATDEGSRFYPTSIYGVSKQSQEQIFMTVAQSCGIPAVALRYQNVYGPGQSLTNPYTGILSIFSTRIRNHAPIAVFEDGAEARDFVYIDDVVEATCLALDEDMANFEVFNVGSGVPTEVRDVAKQLHSALDGQCAIEINGKFRVGDIRCNFADMTKIRSRLGFRPLVTFAEGISRFAEWVMTRPVGQDSLEHSLQELKLRGMYK